MKEVLGAALATVLLLVGCAMYQPAPQWGETDSYQEVVQSAWNDACELSTYSCFGVAKPQIVKTDMMAPGVAGFYYPESKRVHIGKDTNIVENFRNYGTLVHEMVHYLQDYATDHVWPSNKHGSCLREEEAWDVFNELSVKYDYSHLVDTSWATRYGC